jgi:diguanylate cyclase (GGDEF)-like protein
MAVGDIPPGAMIFEITETAAIVDIAGAEAFTRRIAELGCHWALDDFGAGFSSFLYLKSLPFNYVKIDGSFVRDLVTNERDRLVVRAMVEIAHSMGQTTIAEFVEDAGTISVLRELGVDYAQGYYIGRPAPMPDQLPATAALAPAPPTSELSEASLADAAAAAAVTDVLVFRQVAPGRLVHLGGLGRGAGWAGNIELTAADVVAALGGHIARFEADSGTMHIVGPYYAKSAALVPVNADVYVVAGNREHRISTDDDALRALGELATSVVGAVSPAKALADELEVLHAMKAIMQCTPGSVQDAMRHVARTAAEGLSCEIAAVWLPDSNGLELVQNGWSLDADLDSIRVALSEVVRSPLPLCTQNSAAAPLPFPLGPDNGITSHLVLPLGAPAAGYLILAHTQATPRGFTSLCQQVGQTVAQAAGVLIHGTQLRNSLHELVEDVQATARQDSLTGLLNRRGWDEAVASATGSCAWVSVALIDLNDLKAVNDSLGHAAGDDYLRCAAERLLSAAAVGSVVARIGGDEFGVLLVNAESPGEGDFAGPLRTAFKVESATGVPAVRAGVGVAHCEPGADLVETICRADAAMYVDKSLVRPRMHSDDTGAPIR